MDNSSCLSRLVDVVFEIQYETVPQAIIQQAKLCLADFLGIFCSGSTREEAVNLYHALGGSICKTIQRISPFGWEAPPGCWT